MLNRAYFDRLTFELVYNLTCDNRIIHILEAINYVWEFFQLAALVYAKHVPWEVHAFQKDISYALLSFQTNENEFFYIVMVLLMDVMIVYLLVELHKKGGINSFRALELCRALVGVLSTSLFFPILKESLNYISRYISYPDTADIHLSDWIFAIVVIVAGLLAPVCTLTYLSDYDPRHPTPVSSSSSRQQLVWLLLKLVISIAYTFAPVVIYTFTIFVCLLIMLGSGFLSPPFLFPITNLLWACGMGALLSSSIFGIVAAVIENDNPILFYISCGTWLIAAAAVGIFFVLRVNQLLCGFPIWDTETKRVGAEIKRILMCRPATKLTYNEAIATASLSIPTKDLLPRSRMVLDVTFIANTLFATGDSNMSTYIIDYLTKASKKFPTSGLLRARLIVLSACIGEDDPNHRLQIQNMIRKEMKSGATRLDNRYKYYFVMKNFEIDSFRKTVPDIRKMNMLDIIKYHYNLTEARKHHGSTLKWALDFWKAVGAERLHLESIGMLAEKVYTHQAAAFHHYCVVLHDFPASLTGLRSYAAFALDCLNNPGLAQDITEFADHIEEERYDPDSGDKQVDNKIQGALRKSATADDDKSDKQSSVGQNSVGFIESEEANSIFDITSFDEKRNSVAMSNVRKLSQSIIMTLVLLFLVIVAYYIIGENFNADELTQRDLLYSSARLRLAISRADQQSRMLLIDLQNNAIGAAEIAKHQSTMKDIAVSALGYMFIGLYNATTYSQIVLNFWRTPAIDAYVDTKLLQSIHMSPENFFQTYILNILSVVNTPPGNLTASNLDLLWVAQNGIMPKFFDLVMDSVIVYQDSYANVQTLRTGSVQYSLIPIILLPIILSTILFLPAWRRVSLELDAISRLFAKIPRRVAGMLVKEMTEKVTANNESIGLEHGEQVSTSVNSSQDREDEDTTSEIKSPLARQLMTTYMLSLTGSFVFVMGIIVTSIYPLTLFRQRAALVNYSGLRAACSVRIYTQAQQLILDSNAISIRDIIRNNIRDLVIKNSIAHKSVLFDESIKALAFRANRLAALTDQQIANGVYIKDLDEMRIITDSDPVTGRTISAILAARDLYGVMDQENIEILGFIGTVLLCISIPAYIGVWFYLRRSLNRISSRIRRTRNLLFQLPAETIKNIPIISDYLSFGTILVEKKHPPVEQVDKSKVIAKANKLLKTQSQSAKKGEKAPLLGDRLEVNDDDGNSERDAAAEKYLEAERNKLPLKMEEVRHSSKRRSVSFHSPSGSMTGQPGEYAAVMEALRSNAGLDMGVDDERRVSISSNRFNDSDEDTRSA